MRWIFTRKLTFIALSVILWASFAQAAWYDGNWQYRKPITIDPSKVLADQTDFPVLVNLAADADLQTHAQLDGDDILFTSADGLTQLNHEIENYDGAAGNLVAWVKVPALSGSASTVIYLYYGNGSVGPQEDGQNVWIADYHGVWHLGEDQTGTGNNDVYLDSTFPFNHGSDYIAATGQEGQIGKGQQFSGEGDYITIPHHASLNLTGPMTLSYWIKNPVDAGEWNRVIEKGDGGFTTAYYFGSGNGTNDVTYYLTNNEVFDTADNALTTGDWHHVAVTYASNGDATFILDGTATPSGNYSGVIAGNTEPLYFSNPNPTWDSAGFLDEIRIAGADLGADWVITEYNNQSSPADFYSLGPEENLFQISGTVFEDADFAGTASAYDGGASDLALPNVDVELYDGADTFIGTTATAGDGTFSFTGLTDGSYKVRVRSATIGDADSPPAGGLNADVPATWPYPLAEMTWGNGSALYGGQNATADDSDTGDNSGPGDTYVIVTVSGGHLTGIDIGFAYNLIVNTLDDGLSNNTPSTQGSLRQFLKNANGIGAAGGTSANYSRFRIPGAGPHTVSTVSALPAIVETSTLDGDDGSGGRLVIDGTASGNVSGLSVTSSDVVVANLVVQNFVGASSYGIRINDGTTNVTLDNCVSQGHSVDGIRIDWLGSDTDLNHTVNNCTISSNGHDGIALINADGCTFTGNLVENSTRHGINVVGANNGSGNNLFEGNTISGNGSHGVSIFDNGCTNNTFQVNIFHANNNDGIRVGTGGDGTAFYHNSFENNGTGGNGSGININPGVVGVVVRNSLFTNHTRNGVLDNDSGANTSVDHCGFFGNASGPANYDCVTGSQNQTSDPQYAAPGPPGTFALTECTSPAIDAGIDLGVGQPDLNGAGLGNYNGAAPDMGALETSCAAGTFVVSGIVFEDVDFAGAAQGWDGGVGDMALASVDVELYTDADAYLASTTTDGTGSYTFTGMTDGNYKVRVRSVTIGDPDTPPAGGYNAAVPATWPYPLAEMTWGYSAALIGGQDTGGDDTATADNAGPGDTWVSVTVSGGDASGVNFGFCYDLIVNEDDDANADNLPSKQGTLRQFIKNSNAIVGVNKSWFQIPSP